jgi:hypothetical protein
MVYGSGWSAPSPERFIPETETRYPGYRYLGWPQGHSGRVQEILLLPEFDLQIVPAHGKSQYWLIIFKKYIIHRHIVLRHKRNEQIGACRHAAYENERYIVSLYQSYFIKAERISCP